MAKIQEKLTISSRIFLAHALFVEFNIFQRLKIQSFLNKRAAFPVKTDKNSHHKPRARVRDT
ncbi:MAG: hypothetical protein IKA23_09650 [Akkermansia sp.]|nr:hypothetical protein [Akkermansia sp.]